MVRTADVEAPARASVRLAVDGGPPIADPCRRLRRTRLGRPHLARAPLEHDPRRRGAHARAADAATRPARRVRERLGAARGDPGRALRRRAGRSRTGSALGLLTRVRDALPGTYAFALTGPGAVRRATRAREVRAAPARLPDRRRPADPPDASGSPFGSAIYSEPSATVTVSSNRLTPAREPVRDRARAASPRRRRLRHRRESRQRPPGVQEVGRGLDPGHDGQRRDRAPSRATGSRTTSPAARRRAASATTRTSRSTR